MPDNKFIYYTHSESPEIVPADRARDWMDKTNQRFAYRCLPLAMANAHGWFLLNSTKFTAVWDGGDGTDSVHIECEDENNIFKPVSIFGHGVLTFHSGGVFKTPDQISLWASGPPNLVKHGIYPLTGVIETDWSPYSFTMNWKFTKPNTPIAFEINEPFCYLMPIKTATVENLEPEIRNLTDNPDLYKAHTQWSAGRDDFRQKIEENHEKTVEEGWQKDYFHGRNPNGAKGTDTHRTKVKAKNFVDKRK